MKMEFKQKDNMENKKDISYFGKDFGQLRKNLIDFTKQYFPNTYSDFNESSPGMFIMIMDAYVGDVLAYYTDTNLICTSVIRYCYSSNPNNSLEIIFLLI